MKFSKHIEQNEFSVEIVFVVAYLVRGILSIISLVNGLSCNLFSSSKTNLIASSSVRSVSFFPFRLGKLLFSFYYSGRLTGSFSSSWGSLSLMGISAFKFCLSSFSFYSSTYFSSPSYSSSSSSSSYSYSCSSSPPLESEVLLWSSTWCAFMWSLKILLLLKLY